MSAVIVELSVSIYHLNAKPHHRLRNPHAPNAHTVYQQLAIETIWRSRLITSHKLAYMYIKHYLMQEKLLATKGTYHTIHYERNLYYVDDMIDVNTSLLSEIVKNTAGIQSRAMSDGMIALFLRNNHSNMLINNSSHGTHSTRRWKYHRTESFLFHSSNLLIIDTFVSKSSLIIAPNQWERNIRRSKKLNTFISK